MENRLQRNENDKMIAGVASGLAEYLNIDATWVRVAFVLAVFAGLSGILIYIILWIAIPAKPYINLEVDYKVYGDKNDPALNKGAYPPFSENVKKQHNGRMIAGIVLIFMGAYFLTEEFDFLPDWISFDRLWPLALIIPGIIILVKAGKKDYTEQQPEQTTDKKEENIVEEITKNTDQSL